MNKKFKLIIMTVLFSLLITCSRVNATVTTYDRTPSNNYGISDNRISVTSSNKNNILNTPYVDAEDRVYDFAELLTASEETALYRALTDFEEDYEMDMVIVTIDDNPFYYAETFADDFFDYNDFGRNSSRDGILFLIDMDTREMYISTSGTAQLMYDDARIDKILDYTYDEISDQDYYGCASQFVTQSAKFASMGIPSSNKGARVDENGEYIYDPDVPFPIFAVLIISIIVALIFFGAGTAKHKTIRKATQARAYLVKDSFQLISQEDRFISTHTSKVYDPPSSSSSGGGSSTHHSSSGRSHGGGGRHF